VDVFVFITNILNATITVTGYTSVWSLAIYGVSGTIMECIYAVCRQLRVSLLFPGGLLPIVGLQKAVLNRFITEAIQCLPMGLVTN
jgi:hypothetical protein